MLASPSFRSFLLVTAQPSCSLEPSPTRWPGAFAGPCGRANSAPRGLPAPTRLALLPYAPSSEPVAPLHVHAMTAAVLNVPSSVMRRAGRTARPPRRHPPRLPERPRRSPPSPDRANSVRPRRGPDHPDVASRHPDIDLRDRRRAPAPCASSSSARVSTEAVNVATPHRPLPRVATMLARDAEHHLDAGRPSSNCKQQRHLTDVLPGSCVHDAPFAWKPDIKLPCRSPSLLLEPRPAAALLLRPWPAHLHRTASHHLLHLGSAGTLTLLCHSSATDKTTPSCLPGSCSRAALSAKA